MAVIDASSGTIQAFVIDQTLRACRADGQSMTETDWSNVYQHFRSLPEPPALRCRFPCRREFPLLRHSQSLLTVSIAVKNLEPREIALSFG